MDFKEIMSYHSENRAVFNDIKRDLQHIIPFVGVGLSVDVGYPQWGGAIKAICGMIHDRQTRKEIASTIEKKDYVTVTDRLAGILGERQICRKLGLIFAPSEMNHLKLPEAAVSVLPFLFPDTPVITTNFDRVLEKVYESGAKNFIDILLPYRRELTGAANQRGLHMLLKLHGDVSDRAVEWKSIVFTNRQYEAAYSDGSDAVEALKKFTAAHVMLFLGCSLEQDHTVSLLKKIARDNIVHYAVIPCKEGQIDKRLKELAEGENIHAIVYPEGRHEAVRVILEQMLLETDPEAYRRLPYHYGKAKEKRNPFVYDAENIEFYGRSEQIKQLEAFCNTAAPVSWWAVTAPGGAGKSRLAYEFSQRMREQNWHTQFLNQHTYGDMDSLPPVPRDTLVIADYTQGYARQIGAWIRELMDPSYPRSGRVRVLLLERDGAGLEENYSWISQLVKVSIGFSGYLPDCCHDKTFMQLRPLEKEDLQNIMGDYYQRVKTGQTLPADKKEYLFAVLKNVDETLLRPLFALFITDALADGHNPKQWDKKKTLEVLYGKEKRLCHEKIRKSVNDSDRTASICRRVDTLRAIATIRDGVTLPQFKEQYPEFWRDACASMPTGLEDDMQDLLYDIGALTEDTSEIKALKPDLFGEYYVLKETRRHGGLLKTILTDFGDLPVLLFAFRLLTDYPEEIEREKWFMDALLSFTPGSHSNIFSIQFIQLLFTNTLLNLSALLPAKAEKAVQKLQSIHEENPGRVEITLIYAHGLVNLSSKQGLAGLAVTIAQLEKLCEENPGLVRITIAYASGLVNLSFKQDLAGVTGTVEQLRKLHEENPGRVEITLIYAKGLVNLSFRQGLAGLTVTIAQLEKLCEENPGLVKITSLYAKGLVNLSAKQDLEDATGTVGQLRELAMENPGNKELYQIYETSLNFLQERQRPEA